MRSLSGMYSSNSDEWTTPQPFYESLDAEFRFTLDPCAQPQTAKCAKYFTPSQDGLSQDWCGETVFCNPPYSEIAKWVEKCHEESQKPNTKVVMLIPARTDTRWFHDHIYHQAEIRFVKGRLRFSESKINAPFPSMVVVFRGK